MLASPPEHITPSDVYVLRDAVEYKFPGRVRCPLLSALFALHRQLCFTPVKKEVLVAQSYLTLCDPMDCSLPGFSNHGIFQARMLEKVVTPYSRGSSRPRD